MRTMGLLDIILIVTNKATIRKVNICTMEVRVPSECIGDLQDKIYEHFPAYFKVDVKPLGHEEQYTTCICITG